MEILIGFVLLTIVSLLLLVIVGGLFFAFDFFLALPYAATKKEIIATISSLQTLKTAKL